MLKPPFLQCNQRYVSLWKPRNAGRDLRVLQAARTARAYLESSAHLMVVVHRRSTRSMVTRRPIAILLVTMLSQAAGFAPVARPVVACASRALRVSMVVPEAASEVVPLVFEPRMDPSQLGITLGAIAVPFGYWWYITVPEARLKLAKDKRRADGDERQYLDELQRDLQREPDARPVERWFFSKWLRQAKPLAPEPEQASERTATAPAPAEPPPEAVARSDAAPRREPSLGELLRPASLKGNATPKFWSGDNPIVVVTGTLISLGVASSLVRNGGNGQLLLDASVVGAGLVFGLSRFQFK